MGILTLWPVLGCIVVRAWAWVTYGCQSINTSHSCCRCQELGTEAQKDRFQWKNRMREQEGSWQPGASAPLAHGELSWAAVYEAVSCAPQPWAFSFQPVPLALKLARDK